MLVSLLAACCLAAAVSAEPKRLCVTPEYVKDCNEMEDVGKDVGVDIKCVLGTDRFDCLEKIKGPFFVIQMSPKADFMMVDPEDMYIASQKGNNSFRVFKQIRTKDEPEAPFRYEAVAVVPKDLEIKKMSDLKGLRSCHTGIGRNAGYKIPYTTMVKMGVLTPDIKPDLSVIENELKTLSSFFSKSCIVGKWSSHPEINRQLKVKYSNLCQLCESPEKCDYPDSRSGYEGALKCLTEGDGQIAFTKVIAVRKFFGLPYGRQVAQKSNYDLTKYAYLCPDGTKMPLDGPACPWAARPWQGYLAHKNIISGDGFEKLKEDIDKLSTLGETAGAKWRKTVLGLGDDNIPVNIDPVAPLKYIRKARYEDVITREVGGPMSSIKLCEVKKGFIAGKCPPLAASAFSRGIRPKIECINEDSQQNCAEAVDSKKADIFIADPHDAYYAFTDYKLKPLLTETYPNNGSVQYLVVIVPKSSVVQKLADLRNKRLCFWSSEKSDYDMTLKLLVDEGLLDGNVCPYTTRNFALGSYASQTCLTDPTVTVGGKPLFDDAIIRPYVPGLGRDFERYHPMDGFELLCKEPPLRRPLTDVEDCNYGIIPPRMVMVRPTMSEVQRDEIISAMIKIGELYNKQPEYFRFFGDMYSEPDILVSNTATGFAAVKDVVPSFERYKDLMKKINDCDLKDS